MIKRLSTLDLHRIFLDSLGESYVLESEVSKKPLIIRQKTENIKYKVYIYNCTNPPGGRTLDEYKIQLILPDQQRGSRGHLDFSDGAVILLVGFAIFDSVENGAWVIWETDFHRDFAYSANLQVKMGSLIDTLTKEVSVVKKSGNGETIIVSDRIHLSEAIAARQNADIQRLLEEQNVTI